MGLMLRKMGLHRVKERYSTILKPPRSRSCAFPWIELETRTWERVQAEHTGLANIEGNEGSRSAHAEDKNREDQGKRKV